MRRIPFINSNDGPILAMYSYIFGPLAYQFTDIRELNNRIEGLEPVKRMPGFLGSKFNGLAIVKIERAARFTDNGEDAPYLFDDVDTLDVDLNPARSDTSHILGMPKEQLDFIDERGSFAMRDISLLFSFKDREFHLLNYRPNEPQFRERRQKNDDFHGPESYG